MKKKLFLLLLPAMLVFSACDSLNQVLESLPEYNPDPTTGEMSMGLKEALGNGITSAVGILSADGGYLKRSFGQNSISTRS